MNFELMTAGRVIFGPGTIKKAGSALKELAGENNGNLLVVTGSNPDRCGSIIQDIRKNGYHITVFSISGEPTTDMIQEGTAKAAENDCSMVLALGGGSVIDAGKAVSAMMTNPGDLMDYLEVIGKGQTLIKRPAPFIAAPTTSGTGAEVTKNAVLASTTKRVKVSMRSPMMFPSVSIVDPELTLGLPPSVTAASGMDALTQLIEAYVSVKANPITDAFCREGIVRAACALEPAYLDGNNLCARADMALSSLLSGLALANGGLGAVHGVAGPMGGYKDIPHGVICARLLPHVFRMNAERLAQSYDPDDRERLKRFYDIAALITGEIDTTPTDGADRLDDLCRTLCVKPLSHYGLVPEDFEVVSEMALSASSMKGNPVKLEKTDVIMLLEKERTAE